MGGWSGARGLGVLLVTGALLSGGACGEEPAPAPIVAPVNPWSAGASLVVEKAADGRVAVAGVIPGGALPAETLERLAELGAPVATAVRPSAAGADPTAGAIVRDAVALGVALHEGRVTLGDGALAVTGQAAWDADIEELSEEAHSLARRAGVAARWAVARDVTSTVPGFGWVLGARGQSVAGTALTPLSGAGKAVILGEGERVPVGLYRLASGKILGVQEGRRTWLDPEVKGSIRVGGLEVALDDDVPVVGLDAPDGVDFTSKEALRRAAKGSNLSQPRVRGEAVWDVPTEPTELHWWTGSVRALVLHTTMTATAREALDELLKAGLSTHFTIDFDGTLFQSLDVARIADHVNEYNPSTISVELVNPMPNLVHNPDAPPFDPAHPRAAELGAQPREKSPRMLINSGRVQSYGYTAAQERTLAALARALGSVFPRIDAGVPRDVHGALIMGIVQYPGALEGIIGHWHLNDERWDPGPGMDWEALERAIAEGPSPEARGGGEAPAPPEGTVEP